MKKIVLSALALALSAGVVGAAVPAQADTIPAPVGADPAPAADAASYLAAQPEANGLITSYYDFPVGPPFESSPDDVGLTIDAAWALDAVGGQASKLAAMTSAIEANISGYAFGGGSKSKIAAFLLSRGVDSTAVLDVVADVEDNHIGDSAPIVGRLVDADPNDFNTPLTQAFAVSALNNAGSDLANSALSYLLDQQCAAGFFRGSFPAKDAVDQTCDGAAPAATGSVDTTGLVLLMLQDQKSKPFVKAAVNDGLDWLATQQAADGSFNAGNANSTGLAGWALGRYGRTGDASEAARWLRGQQLANAGACRPYADDVDGAVVVDELGLLNAQDGLDDIENSSATRATAQAAPALLWSPGGVGAGAFTLTGPSGFAPAGSDQQYSLEGAPGDTVCVGTTRVVLGAAGTGTASVRLPSTTGTTTVSATDAGGESHSLSITGLARTKLGVKLARTSVAKGGKVVVTVSRLAEGETVTVKLNGKKAVATARRNGKAKVRLVAVKVGKTSVTAVGEYKNRKGKASLTVTA